MSSSALKTVSLVSLMCLFDMAAISAPQDDRAKMELEELECLSGKSCHFYTGLEIKWSGLDIAWLDD